MAYEITGFHIDVDASTPTASPNIFSIKIPRCHPSKNSYSKSNDIPAGETQARRNRSKVHFQFWKPNATAGWNPIPVTSQTFLSWLSFGIKENRPSFIYFFFLNLLTQVQSLKIYPMPAEAGSVPQPSVCQGAQLDEHSLEFTRASDCLARCQWPAGGIDFPSREKALGTTSC